MRCSKCGSNDLDFMVSLYVTAPIKFYGKITKTNLAKKEFKIVGAGWPHCSFSCNKCGALIFPDRNPAADELKGPHSKANN